METEAETEVETKAETEAETEPPSDLFKASSQDPWLGQTTPAPVIVDDRFYHPTKDQLDWSWTPESSGEISAPQPQVVSIGSNLPSSAPSPVLSPGYPPPSVATAPSHPPVAPVGLGYHQDYAGGYAAVGYPPAVAAAPGNQPGPAEKTDPASDGATAARPSVFTRLKQKLSVPLERITNKIKTGFSSLSHRADGGSRLPSLSSMRKQIKSALGLPETLTASEPGPGLLDNLESVTKERLQSVNLALRKFVSNSKEMLNKPPQYQSSAYQTSYDSTAAVTEIPIPLPVPTYLPVRKSGEFSAGFQVLMQYVVAMIGVAVVLAI